MRTVKSCGVLVFRSEPVESFLLLKHPVRYDLPKGHLEDGESEIECALRELWEETGIRADHVDLDLTFRFTSRYRVQLRKFPGEDVDKTLVIFLGRLTSRVEIALTEHVDHEWIAWDPPHRIQRQTIDPLLAQWAEHQAAGESTSDTP